MPDKLNCGWERLEFLLKEPGIRDLITEYFEELSPFTDIPLDIDWGRLLDQERAGIYRIWTARVNNTLAGFCRVLRPDPYVSSHHPRRD